MKSKKELEAEKEQLALFKKDKPIISKGELKRIVAVKRVDTTGCYWFDRWMEQLVRENSYPPQLKSEDFYSLLSRYFEGKMILEILEKARTEYRKAFPLSEAEATSDDDLSWLVGILKMDQSVIASLPPNYLM